jgi:hypothetical protein
VHIYSRFLRKIRSNRGSLQQSAPEREHARAAASPARRAAPRRCIAPASPHASAPLPRSPCAHAAQGPALQGRPFPMPRACRGCLERRAAVQLHARPRGPLVVAVPVALPSVRRSLGGSHCSYKGAAALYLGASALPAAPEPHAGALGPAAASSNFRTTASQIKPPFTAPSTYRNYRAAPPVVSGLDLAGAGRTTAGRGCRRHRVAPPGPPHRPDFIQIRPLATPALPHARPRPAPPPAPAGISPEPRRPAPKGHIVKRELFLRAEPQSKGICVTI